MATPFNPYQEWLQLDAPIERPSYYELLGIKPSLTEEKAIAAAADRAASRVRSHRPGAHAVEWAQLLDEIAAAKKCLLDQAARRQYDQDTSGARAEPPTTKTALEQGASNLDMYPPGVVPQSSYAPKTKVAQSSDGTKRSQNSAASIKTSQLPASLPIGPDSSHEAMHPWVPPTNSADPMAPLVIAAASVPYLKPVDSANVPAMYPMAPNPMAPLAAMTSEPPISASEPILAVVASPRSRDDRGRMAAWVKPILMGLAAGFVLLVALLIYRKLTSSETQQIAEKPATKTDSVEPSIEAESKPGEANTTPGPIESVVTPVQNAQQVLTPLADPKSVIPSADNHEVAKEPAAKPAPPSMDLTKVADLKAETVSERTPKKDSKEVKPAAEAKSATEQPASPSIAEPSKPTVTKQELMKLGRAMQKTRDAIGNHEFDLAAEFLAIAAKLPQSPEHSAKLDRLKLLLDAVQQYRQAIDASVAKLEVGVTFDVNNTVVGIVEASRDKVVFRSAGRSLGYAIPELPPALAAVLAEQTLDVKDPATLAMKGAFIISSRKATQADLAKARGFLDEAAASNDTAKGLLPILEDSYDLSQDVP